MRRGNLLSVLACTVVATVLVGCAEVDQKAKTEKVYAGKKDAYAYDNKLFGNDKKKWEASLAQRTSVQNEYLRTDTK